MTNFTLVKYEPKYLEGLIYMCNNIDRTYLNNRLPQPYTMSDAKEWTAIVQKKEGSDMFYRLILVEGKVIGSIAVDRMGDVSSFNGELGYMVLKPYWGKGIASEATKELCAYVFSNSDLLRLTAHIYAPNISSRKVAEKNGFVLEGTMRQAIVKDENHIYDLCIYGKLKP